MLALILGIIVGGINIAEAAGKKTKKMGFRVVEKDYAPGSDGGRMLVAPYAAAVTLTQVSFAPRLKEAHVSVTITDDSGQPVPARITQNDSDMSGWFCGRTDAPVTIARGLEIEVWVYSGPCDNAVGLGTRGTITATFSR